MAAFTKFEVFTEDVAKKIHNFDTDTLKVALSNTLPDSANDEIFSDITEITAGGGYTAGGADITNTVSRTGGVTSVDAVTVTWTGTGSGFGPLRYFILYNATATNSPLIGYWDYGSSITVLSGEPLKAVFSTAAFTIT